MWLHCRNILPDSLSTRTYHKPHSAFNTTIISVTAFPALLSSCLALLLHFTWMQTPAVGSYTHTHLNITVRQLSSFERHIINITYSLLMWSTKIILLWSVKHCIIVLMLLFEALGSQPHCFSWGQKVSQVAQEMPQLEYLYRCRHIKGKNITNYHGKGHQELPKQLWHCLYFVPTHRLYKRWTTWELLQKWSQNISIAPWWLAAV